MATGRVADYLDEDLVCPVCLDLFIAPVILECGHNFCRSCIDKVWDTEQILSCPECRAEWPAKKYTINRVLAKIVEKAQVKQEDTKGGKPQQGQKSHCALGSQQCLEHKEELKLFCKEDESPLCVICVVSQKHAGHTFLPLREAVSMFQKKLKEVSSLLELKLKGIKALGNQQQHMISDLPNKSLRLEQHIRSEFVKLHRLLQDKEQSLIEQLKKEAAGSLGKMEENLKDINVKQSIIQNHLTYIQLTLQQEDPVNFLREFRDHEERYMQPAKKDVLPDVVLGTCDGSRERYNYVLHHEDWNEWKCNMRTVPSPLTLDPDTAQPNLILSEDLTSVRHADVTHHLPDNPKRFDYYVCVLGKEGFYTGQHYWEVEVKNKTDWDVGVTTESSNRKGRFKMNAKHGYWRIMLRNGNTYTAADSSLKDLTLTVKPQWIGVYLDYEGGQVSLYNADNMSHIYTFTDKFTEKIYPFFSPCLNYKGENAAPLKLFHLKL
ncbi:zinc-binding protein A33-like [Protopterus annectens]|uniref:zinc-binding protein A33-like n=1 Tax=Protopterus annectens TaxID=7888 RepID=UPI001CFB6384|nr:zinc-binding protein A33-like [Protopterus annectens]